jgi:hypothetical protein
LELSQVSPVCPGGKTVDEDENGTMLEYSDRGKLKHWNKDLSQCYFVTNVTWTGLGLNRVFYSDGPVTNYFSHVTALEK